MTENSGKKPFHKTSSNRSRRAKPTEKQEDKPFKSRSKSHSDKTGNDKPFKSRSKSDSEKSWNDKPFKSRSKSDSEKTGSDKPFKSRSKSDSEKSWNDKPFKSRSKSDSEKTASDKPFKSRSKSDSEKSWNDKPFKSRSKSDSEKTGSDKPFKSRSKSDSEKSWNDKPFKSRSKSDSEKTASDKPFKSRSKSDSEKSWNDKPFKSRSKSDSEKTGSDKPFKSRSKSDSEKSWNDKPFKSRSKSDSEKTGNDKPFKSRSKFDSNKQEDNHFKTGAKPDNKRQKSFKTKDKNQFFEKESDGIRLNKFIANAGICSRREADTLIETGSVSVNGKVVTELGTKITKTDTVKVEDKVIKIEKNVYVLLNKPKDYITTSKDPQNRRTVMELIKNACKERIYPVGRLDRNTTGLLLFTNDGDLAKKLTHPSYNISKVYQVTLDQALRKSDLDAIAKGVELDDGFVKVDDIDYDRGSDGKREIGIELHSGQNRVVRRIFEKFDYKVIKLDRVLYAGLTKKDLPRGKWRLLTEKEIASLKRL